MAAVFIPAVDPSDSNDGGEGFIRLAYTWEPPERNREGAKFSAEAIKNAC